jgi:hypothetical protein
MTFYEAKIIYNNISRNMRYGKYKVTGSKERDKDEIL